MYKVLPVLLNESAYDVALKFEDWIKSCHTHDTGRIVRGMLTYAHEHLLFEIFLKM